MGVGRSASSRYSRTHANDAVAPSHPHAPGKQPRTRRLSAQPARTSLAAIQQKRNPTQSWREREEVHTAAWDLALRPDLAASPGQLETLEHGSARSAPIQMLRTGRELKRIPGKPGKHRYKAILRALDIYQEHLQEWEVDFHDRIRTDQGAALLAELADVEDTCWEYYEHHEHDEDERVATIHDMLGEIEAERAAIENVTAREPDEAQSWARAIKWVSHYKNYGEESDEAKRQARQHGPGGWLMNLVSDGEFDPLQTIGPFTVRTLRYQAQRLVDRYRDPDTQEIDDNLEVRVCRAGQDAWEPHTEVPEFADMLEEEPGDEPPDDELLDGPVARLKLHVRTSKHFRTRFTPVDLFTGHVGHVWLELKYLPNVPVPSQMRGVGVEQQNPRREGDWYKALTRSLPIDDPKQPEGSGAQMWLGLGRTTFGFGPRNDEPNLRVATQSIDGLVHQPDPATGMEHATQTWDIDHDALMDLVAYVEANRRHEYNMYTYNCTTFALEACRVAGVNPPSGKDFTGICLPTNVYASLKKRFKRRRGERVKLMDRKPLPTINVPPPPGEVHGHDDETLVETENDGDEVVDESDQ